MLGASSLLGQWQPGGLQRDTQEQVVLLGHTLLLSWEHFGVSLRRAWQSSGCGGPASSLRPRQVGINGPHPPRLRKEATHASPRPLVGDL